MLQSVLQGKVGQVSSSQRQRSVMPWQLVPFGEEGLPCSGGCNRGANDRDNMSVFYKQTNMERAEVVMLGPRLCQVSGALSLQFLSLVHFHRLSAAAGFEDCSVSASGS